LLQQGAPTDADPALTVVGQSPSRTNVGEVDEQGRIRPRKSMISLNESTPKGRSGFSLKPTSSVKIGPSTKKPDTVAYTYETMRRNSQVPEPRWGGHRYKGTYKGAPVVDDFDIISHDDADDPDVSFEGLDNVRGECSSR
jgi:hypothetical protein